MVALQTAAALIQVVRAIAAALSAPVFKTLSSASALQQDAKHSANLTVARPSQSTVGLL
jgi:hypothetical protein